MRKTNAQDGDRAAGPEGRRGADFDEDSTGTLVEPLAGLDHPGIGRLVEPGDRLGAYRVGRVLGRGGAGDVFLGYGIRPGTERRVAVKVLQRGLSGGAQERFENECRILATLDHASIARLYDARATDSVRPYVIMEYVDGERIDAYCDRLRCSVRHRLQLVREVCTAVGYAHSKRVVHLDIKPSNILVTAEGVPKLLDFGIARLIDAREGQERGEPRRRPMTLGYASPEQAGGGPLTTATDVYALGMLLYKLLTGRLPFPPGLLRRAEELERFVAAGPRPAPPSLAFDQPSDPTRADSESRGATVARLRSTTPEGLRLLLTGDLDSLVLRTIAHAPEERYASALELSEELGRVLAR